MSIQEKLDSVTTAKGRLAILAHEEAAAAHPDGYSKQQLVDASRRVFGGFAVNPHKPIRTQQDITDAGNALAFVDGRYPAGMSDCYTVGLSGGCGADCPVLRRGDCDSPPDGTTGR